MTITLVLITVYIISAYIWYKAIQRLYDPVKGLWYNLKPGYFEVIVTFIPIMNTVWGILALLDSIRIKDRPVTFFDKK